MKSLLIGMAAMVIGLGGGAFVSGNKVKTVLVQAAHDSIAAAEAAAHPTEGSVSEADPAPGSTEGGVSLDVSQIDEPAAEGPGSGEAGTGTPSDDPIDPRDAGALPVGTTAGPLSTPPAESGDQSGQTAMDAAEEPAPAGSTPTGPVAGPPAGAAPGGATPAELAEAAKKLSKIFGAMKAPDAAAVLQEMTDDEVKAILLEMSDRLAAGILGEFEPTRAAELTRAVLMARGGGA